MKILMFVTNPFTSDPRVYNEARALVKADFRVTVIAWDRDKQNPPSQTWDGIEIIRLRTRLLPQKHNFSSPLWVAPNMLLWQQQAFHQALKLHKEEPFDAIHCHDMDTLNIGVRLKKKLGLPLIYDAHEIYGYMMHRHFPHPIANLFLWWEKRLLPKVDRIINVGEAQKQYFTSITNKPIPLIRNCKPLQSLEYQPPDNHGDFTLLYIGGLAYQRGVMMLVHAAKDMAGVRCLIGGIGQQSYVAELEKECSKTSNVTFLGKVPFEEVIPMTKKVDCIFCMFDPTDLNNITGAPNKLFEAMVCGRPIICTKGTYSGEVTEQEKVGLSVEYTEAALKDAIIKLRDNPELREALGRNALNAAIRTYNWKRQETKLLELYQDVLAQRKSS